MESINKPELVHSVVISVGQSDSVIYICNINIIYSFSDFFLFVARYWIWFPVLYSRTLLFIYFTYSSVYLLIPNLSLPELSPLVAINLLCLPL